MIAPTRSARFAAAYGLDWIAGDPHGMPHPVRFIGLAISAGERWLRQPSRPSNEVLRGALLTGSIVLGSWATARFLVRRSGPWGEVLLAWTTLATRSLLDESAAVLDALERDDIVQARKRLATIVGRDTQSLGEAEIVRAVVETVAEGLCDGVVAPIFFLVLGGVPLALAYKAVNTLDSMIGHYERPYRYFGRVAARVDDAANFIPARLTALTIIGAAILTGGDGRQAWTVFRRDRHQHPSPNAGQSEAAMAGALGVRLGGMNYYGGEPSPKPVLGGEGRSATCADAHRAFRIAGVASLAVFSAAWLWFRWREKST
jgi:adenosylcobinamide-phosphate synthase